MLQIQAGLVKLAERATTTRKGGARPQNCEFGHITGICCRILVLQPVPFALQSQDTPCLRLPSSSLSQLGLQLLALPPHISGIVLVPHLALLALVLAVAMIFQQAQVRLA